MLSEFKKFVMKGNVMDLAVGVIIGAAFGAIVTSLVGDVIMPIVAAIFGGLDFSNNFIALSDGVTATTLEEARKQGNVLAIGSFVTAVVNFLIMGFIIFMIVRTVNKLTEKPKEEEAPAAPPAQEVLLAEIRDLLAKGGKTTRSKK